jgi:maltooligosyltrehalose trehalohydrolase
LRPNVWAPLPERVELVVGEQKVPMSRTVGGWWQAEGELDPGTDYGFSLDGRPPLPDPRSRHQPNGVHGLSRVYETRTRTDDRWHGFDLSTALFYEMHVGTFTPEGTLPAAAKRLDHLLELGVNVVEVMPVNQFSGRHGWGYDGVGLYAVHNAYGGPDGFKQFISDCHANGLGVVLDVVYNHLGPVGNYLSEFGPYFTDMYQTPWGDAVNLDGPGSDEVRRFFVDNALMWLGDFGVDGLRLDAVHALVDRSAVHFLEELSGQVDILERRMGRPLWLIAESDLNDPRLLWSRERGGYELDATWSDDFHHSLHALLTGERDGYYRDFGSYDDLATALQAVYVYDRRYSVVRDRRHGRPVDGLAGTRFLGYLQNHDQVGNRARGERIGQLVDERRLYIGATLVLTSPFVPLIFQGEEWATTAAFPYFSDHSDPDLAEAVRRGRRKEFSDFGWDPEEIPDPQDAATFQSAKLRWDEIDRLPHRDILHWYRSLIQLRRDTPDLVDGRLERVSVGTNEEAATLVMQRGRIVVAVNFSEEARIVEVPGHRIDLGPASVAIAELLP